MTSSSSYYNKILEDEKVFLDQLNDYQEHMRTYMEDHNKT